MIENTWETADRLWRELGSATPGTEEHSRILSDLTKLIDMQDRLYERVKSEPSVLQQILVSPAFIGGVLQIGFGVMVLHFEKFDTVTSRIFQWIRFR